MREREREKKRETKGKRNYREGKLKKSISIERLNIEKLEEKDEAGHGYRKNTYSYFNDESRFKICADF